MFDNYLELQNFISKWLHIQIVWMVHILTAVSLVNDDVFWHDICEHS